MSNVQLMVLVNSDNVSETLMTVEAYKELRLQMSTGDFHSHTHAMVEADLDDAEYLDLSEAEFILINEKGQQ